MWDRMLPNTGQLPTRLTTTALMMREEIICGWIYVHICGCKYVWLYIDIYIMCTYIHIYIYIWVHIHIQALREYLVADHHGFVDERDGHLWRNVYVICINVDVYICSYINIFTYIICTWREHVAQLTYKALMMSKAIACDAIWIYMFMYTCIFTYTYIYMYIYI